MKNVKRVFAVLAGLWLVSMLILGFGGDWMSKGTDQVAGAVLKSSGIQEQIDTARQARCDDAQAAYQEAWDDAVESGRVEQNQSELDRVERQVEALCQTN